MKIKDGEAKEGPGLAKGFAVGELLAWKGLCFIVETVEYDRLTLLVKGITKKSARRKGLI